MTDAQSAIVCRTELSQNRTFQTLQEAVGCYGSVVSHLSHEYTRVLSILKSCEAKLRVELANLRKKGSMPEQTQRTLPLYMHIATLLVAYCNLDEVKADRLDVAAELRSITEVRLVVMKVYLSVAHIAALFRISY